MAKTSGLNTREDNLLARLLSLFYVIPPAVLQTPVTHQRGVMRINLPVSRMQKYSGRARELSETSTEQSVVDSDPVNAIKQEAETEFDDSESDPVRSLQLGSGPGHSARDLAARKWGRYCLLPTCSVCAKKPRSTTCCHCNCDCCRRRQTREWLLPRAEQASECVPLRAQSATNTKPKLKIIKDAGNCVLGSLPCGYVLSGSGSVKARKEQA
jgi:hypothetical protein